MILKNGQCIFPNEIESVLESHNLIEEALVTVMLSLYSENSVTRIKRLFIILVALIIMDEGVVATP